MNHSQGHGRTLTESTITTGLVNLRTVNRLTLYTRSTEKATAGNSHGTATTANNTYIGFFTFLYIETTNSHTTNRYTAHGNSHMSL